MCFPWALSPHRRKHIKGTLKAHNRDIDNCAKNVSFAFLNTVKFTLLFMSNLVSNLQIKDSIALTMPDMHNP